MPDIDLTPMNEATARELFAHVTTENALQKMDLTPEEEPVMRLRWQENMRLHWDDTPATDDKKLYFRELALAATLTTWKDVARQAWQQGHETPRDYVVDLTLGGEDAHVIVGPPQPNPYDPTVTAEDGGPLGD